MSDPGAVQVIPLPTVEAHVSDFGKSNRTRQSSAAAAAATMIICWKWRFQEVDLGKKRLGLLAGMARIILYNRNSDRAKPQDDK